MIATIFSTLLNYAHCAPDVPQKHAFDAYNAQGQQDFAALDAMRHTFIGCSIHAYDAQSVTVVCILADKRTAKVIAALSSKVSFEGLQPELKEIAPVYQRLQAKLVALYKERVDKPA